MRIVNLETFLKMPVGTVYSRYKEEFDESFELCIKGESDVEFEFSKHQRLLEPVNLPISPSDQHSFENNLNKEIEIGYDRDSLFIVFEQRDTENLIERLKNTLPKQDDGDYHFVKVGGFNAPNRAGITYDLTDPIKECPEEPVECEVGHPSQHSFEKITLPSSDECSDKVVTKHGHVLRDKNGPSGIFVEGRTSDEQVERLAEEIYNKWQDQKGWVPWVPNGNSLKQDEARKLAIHELNARRAEEY